MELACSHHQDAYLECVIWIVSIHICTRQGVLCMFHHSFVSQSSLNLWSIWSSQPYCVHPEKGSKARHTDFSSMTHVQHIPAINVTLHILCSYLLLWTYLSLHLAVYAYYDLSSSIWDSLGDLDSSFLLPVYVFLFAVLLNNTIKVFFFNISMMVFRHQFFAMLLLYKGTQLY